VAACHTSNKFAIMRKRKLIDSDWNPNSNDAILPISIKMPTPFDLQKTEKGELSRLK